MTVDELGYTTISVKPPTRERVRELREERDQTTDELVNSLLDAAENDETATEAEI